MKKRVEVVGDCPDCGKKEVQIVARGVYAGVCSTCARRKQNCKARGKEYIPYIDLSEKEREKIDILQKAQAKKKEIEIPEVNKTVKVVENYYQVKAENNPAIAQIIEKPVIQNIFNPLADKESFVKILKEYGCKIPDTQLQDMLDMLISTNELKNILAPIINTDNQFTILDLEQSLNTTERDLQQDWECNGFREIDDIKFKGFLTWRRMLKEAMVFWKQLYQTNIINEMQKIWNVPTNNNEIKQYQITTESISTIFNTKRPFTRVFSAKTKEDAYNDFIKWMAEHQLHENKSKTTITELIKGGKNE